VEEGEREPPDDEDRDPFDGVLDDEIPFEAESR
jgi:hypothetical protein